MSQCVSDMVTPLAWRAQTHSGPDFNLQRCVPGEENAPSGACMIRPIPLAGVELSTAVCVLLGLQTLL